MSAFRHPVVVVSHGPGPLWLLTPGYEGMNRHTLPARTLAELFPKLYPDDKNLPKRIFFVSAHFESERSGGFEISSSANPKMFYDYSGFPAETYQVEYPAKGDPAFAQKVKGSLEKNNIQAKLVDRGFDHGVFVPMLLIRPQADIPIASMSINSRLDNKAHFDVGKAISSFRNEDTLIFCSGQSTHNLRGVRDLNHPIVDWAAAFQNWIDDTFTSKSTLTYDQRAERTIKWQEAPGARLAHPTPDYFIPFVVAAGAGMDEKNPGAESFFGGWGAGHLTFANYAWGLPYKVNQVLRSKTLAFKKTPTSSWDLSSMRRKSWMA
ncbi:hypothetical protein V7S43_006986 [Phytophthora oleae]|uniref:Extradiol ring-cleavage dioxygenase class III enzyme subunit B domain-containing protein n=1 Tax=Phytophthora oleae TaxID=2107226 RepID=A0ABD3FMZ3_9STRA